MEHTRLPLLDLCCAGCGVSGTARTLSVCSRCQLSRYCGKECQRAAWKGHKLLCREAEMLGSLCEGRSFLKMAKDCVRAQMCMQHLGLTRATLHPLQRARLEQLQEAVDFVQAGQMPPVQYTCFNRHCNRKTELIEYHDERELREFVVSGLCAGCQAKAFADLETFAGPETEHPAPAGRPPQGRALAHFPHDGKWMDLRVGLKLLAGSTLWEDDNIRSSPLWVAGEVVEYLGGWEFFSGRARVTGAGHSVPSGVGPGDGVVVVRTSAGRRVEVPLARFRERSERGDFQLGFAVAAYQLRGCLFLQSIVIDGGLHDLPPLGAYITLTRIKGLDMKNAKLQSMPQMQSMCPVASALLKLICDDIALRQEGRFEAFYSIVPAPRRPLPPQQPKGYMDVDVGSLSLHDG